MNRPLLYLLTVVVLVLLYFAIPTKKGRLIYAALAFPIALFYSILKVKKQKDNFHFEVSPYKLCGGGPYMRSSDPKLQKLCNSIPEEDIAKANCCRGFNGRPLGFVRTPMSDGNWENRMCD